MYFFYLGQREYGVLAASTRPLLRTVSSLGSWNDPFSAIHTDERPHQLVLELSAPLLQQLEASSTPGPRRVLLCYAAGAIHADHMAILAAPLPFGICLAHFGPLTYLCLC